uniref:Uncharacterized protein n=1 Tax=Vespula pensylvanica TaxID=30213 RepID=A0A834NS45_VESPE|nr:hypothetical protein H0235_011497 [Vespula pensylvanica]
MLWILIVVTCFEVSTLADAQSERTTSLDEDANNNEPDHPANKLALPNYRNYRKIKRNSITREVTTRGISGKVKRFNATKMPRAFYIRRGTMEDVMGRSSSGYNLGFLVSSTKACFAVTASQPERDSNDSPAKVSTFRCSSVQAFRYSDYFEETLDFHDTHPASRGFRQRQWICIRST